MNVCVFCERIIKCRSYFSLSPPPPSSYNFARDINSVYNKLMKRLIIILYLMFELIFFSSLSRRHYARYRDKRTTERERNPPQQKIQSVLVYAILNTQNNRIYKTRLVLVYPLPMILSFSFSFSQKFTRKKILKSANPEEGNSG